MVTKTDMKVELIDSMGNDDSVVNAARVSFNKTAEQFKPEQNEKLIRYLAELKHEIPFAHTAISLRVKAPISIRTQCFKHKIGFVENEVSRRYVKDSPEFFTPDFRFAPDKSIKQGSGDLVEKYWVREIAVFNDENQTDYNSTQYVHANSKEDLEKEFEKWKEENQEEFKHFYFSDTEVTQEGLQESYQSYLEHSIALYDQLIGYGLAPEQVRFIMPQGMMTEWVWTGSLLAFARFYNLRKTPYAQKEIKDLAIMVGDIIKELYPISWEALTKD